ncbi:MAG: hypothetical protein PHW39_02875 [Syntrophomonadaceae bacterium]|nr:hypothetical protein [Syntrophomonadaceae bacterium]
MQELLNELNTRITALDAMRNHYALPEGKLAGEVVLDYLEFQQSQRAINQQINDLVQLRDKVQAEIDMAEMQAQEMAKEEAAKIKEKNTATETKKIIKQLSKADLCSPEVANKLVDLTILRRQ